MSHDTCTERASLAHAVHQHQCPTACYGHRAWFRYAAGAPDRLPTREEVAWRLARKMEEYQLNMPSPDLLARLVDEILADGARRQDADRALHIFLLTAADTKPDPTASLAGRILAATRHSAVGAARPLLQHTSSTRQSGDE